MKRPIVIAGTLAGSISLLWFLAVDWSWFVEDCPDCGNCRDVAQYRIFSIPVSENTYEHPTTTQRVSVDLGAGCTHPRATRWHKHRWWGLCYCKSPCINGIYVLQFDESWYTDEVSERISELAHNDPSLPAQFAQRVLNDHDYDFVATVLGRAGVQRDSQNKKPRAE